MDIKPEWTTPNTTTPNATTPNTTTTPRTFLLPRASAPLPAALWLPPGNAVRPPRPPLVLLGHGGSGHKTSARIQDLARWFTTHAGCAALAIDGPHHGERVPAPLPPAVYQARIAEEGIEAVLDRMTDDWLAAIDAVSDAGRADGGRVAYLGLSMGARFGIPLAAALGDRLRCAVLGKFGVRLGPALHPGLDAPERVTADARRITAPVLFHIQWDDELFPRAGQLALFDALGSQDKELIAYTGPHDETRPTAIATWRDFISRHLGT
ncbi:dienelactone hydrolase family protein [Streptomyces sp. NPDC051940]|uniref:dienelactone hydrolase family protein n=1 Tax=Streptomyces sp. NPDC051940 TaxID=3155675 RepID=UPI00343E88AF